MLEEEYQGLVKSVCGRTYAEDIGALLRETKASLFDVARGLESGDPSAGKAAPEEIRGAIRNLQKGFEAHSSHLDVGEDERREVDVVEVVRQLLLLRQRQIHRVLSSWWDHRSYL